LKALGSQSPETRCKVPLRYKELFGKELKDVMKTECGSKDFGLALQFLAQNPVAAECDMIMSACKGLGTKEKLLGTIICGRSNAEMTLLKKTFFDIHTKDLYVNGMASS
jgi:Annexin